MTKVGYVIVALLWVAVLLYASLLADAAGFGTPLSIALIVLAVFAVTRWWKYLSLAGKKGRA